MSNDGIDVLYEYGLTPLQAKIFVDLLSFGPSLAKDLSNRLDLNRVDVYRVLGSLKKRGLVEVTLQNPSLFTATHPKVALEILMNEEEERLLQLRRRSREVLAWLATLQTNRSKTIISDESPNPLFKIIYGRALFECWRKMLKAAKSEVLSVWSDYGLKLISDRGFIEPFVDCVERGIGVRMIATIDERNYEAARRFMKIVNLRHSEFVESSFRYVIVDQSQAVISAISTPAVSSHILSAVWTDSAAFVVGIKNEFEMCWKTSTEAKSRMVTLQSSVTGGSNRRKVQTAID